MPSDHTGKLKTLVSLAEQLERHGDRPAMIRFTREDRETWSFSRLGREAGQMAAGLRAAGLKKGDRLAVMAGPSPGWFVTALGLLRAGGVLVPIDTQMSDQNLHRVITDSKARWIFASSRLARRVRGLKHLQELEIVLLDEPGDEQRDAETPVWTEFLAEGASAVESIGEDDDAILFYTSGTTGPPKGVPLTHRNILFQIQSLEKTGLVNADDRMLLPLPLHHVYPLVIGMLTPLALGVTILIPQALTGEGLTRALREGKGTVILGVPRLYQALFQGIQAKLGAAGSIGARLFSGALALSRVARRIHVPLGRLLFRPIRNKMGPDVRILASGGSPLDPGLGQNLEALGWPVAIGYGLTETSPLLTLKRPGEGRFASVGRPIEGVELRIDPEGLPEGERKAQESGKTGHERGEVLARGESVFKGYYKLPDKTREAITDGWFHTGDLGYLEDGFLYLNGRVSSMIVLQGGENIDPEDLEDIYGETEAVAEIGIVEDDGKLAALVVPDRSVLRGHAGDDLREIVGKRLKEKGAKLASYKKLSRIEVTRQSLPRTSLGKIRRHLLQERYEAAKKGEDDKPRETGPVSIDSLPSDDRALLEDAQARKLWDFLGKRYKDRRLTPDASLELDLGVDSLEWVELSLSVQERTGILISEDMIETVETVRDLLEKAIDAASGAGVELKKPIEKPEDILDESDKLWATPRGSFATAVATFFYGLMRALLRLYCRVKARGLDNLPEKGPYLLVPNHVSFLDGPTLAVALGYRKGKSQFWAGRGDLLFRSFFRRMVSRIAQIVPIDPKRGPMSSLAVSALLMKRGHPLVWFPEGRISKDGSLQEFQPGIGLIIDYYEPPVVPVHLQGTHEALPLGKLFPRPEEVTVFFGKPIDAEKLKAEANHLEEGEVHQRIVQVLHKAVRELGEAAKRDGRKAA